MKKPLVSRLITWYQSDHFRKDIVDKILKTVQIFIFVGFGYLLGWYSVALEVSKCEIRMEQLSHENTRMMLGIAKKHQESLEKQRNSYQLLIKNELTSLAKKVESNNYKIHENQKLIDKNSHLIKQNRNNHAVGSGSNR
ncbi:hypothetical protein [uncultured Parasutterella sp.]|uniref:hypothetical protein n=1 Tax=uncultured Parasutterella sp. TaxID=1263098 RepID=UPI0034A576FE